MSMIQEFLPSKVRKKFERSKVKIVPNVGIFVDKSLVVGETSCYILTEQDFDALLNEMYDFGSQEGYRRGCEDTRDELLDDISRMVRKLSN